MLGRHKTLLDTSQIITNNYQRLLEKAGGARSSCRRQVFLPGTPTCGTPSCFYVLGIPHAALPFIPPAAEASPVLSPTPELRVGAAAAVPALGAAGSVPQSTSPASLHAGTGQARQRGLWDASPRIHGRHQSQKGGKTGSWPGGTLLL